MSELLRLSVHFGERDRLDGELLADAIMDDFERHRLATSVLLRGVGGFGLRHHLRTDRLLTVSEDLPVLATAVDRQELVEAALSALPGPRGSGLLTLDRLGAAATGAEDRKLTIYLRRRQRAAGTPAFLAVCDLLRSHGVAGATAILGVDGAIGGHRRRGRFFSVNADVPMLVVAVGASSRLSASAEELEELLGAPTMTSESVQVCKRDGELIAPPPQLPWQRLTVYTSESATSGGHAIHHELIRRLRRSGARGATSVRGIWGFHGDQAPHGDRLLQLRRRAPILTTVVDEGSRIAADFAVIDELTCEHGLVTAEPVGVVPQAVAS